MVKVEDDIVQAGARLFGFVGAGATLGQLVGSIFAVIFARFGPCITISKTSAYLSVVVQCDQLF